MSWTDLNRFEQGYLPHFRSQDFFGIPIRVLWRRDRGTLQSSGGSRRSGAKKMGSDQSWKMNMLIMMRLQGKNVTMGYDMGCDIGYGIRYQIWYRIWCNVMGYLYIYPNYTKIINIIWVWLKTVNSTHSLHGNFKRDTVMMDNHQWISGHPLLKQLTLTVSKPWNHGEHQNYQRADVHPKNHFLDCSRR